MIGLIKEETMKMIYNFKEWKYRVLENKESKGVNLIFEKNLSGLLSAILSRTYFQDLGYKVIKTTPITKWEGLKIDNENYNAVVSYFGSIKIPVDFYLSGPNGTITISKSKAEKIVGRSKTPVEEWSLLSKKMVDLLTLKIIETEGNGKVDLSSAFIIEDIEKIIENQDLLNLFHTNLNFLIKKSDPMLLNKLILENSEANIRQLWENFKSFSEELQKKEKFLKAEIQGLKNKMVNRGEVISFLDVPKASVADIKFYLEKENLNPLIFFYSPSKGEVRIESLRKKFDAFPDINGQDFGGLNSYAESLKSRLEFEEFEYEVKGLVLILKIGKENIKELSKLIFEDFS